MPVLQPTFVMVEEDTSLLEADARRLVEGRRQRREAAETAHSQRRENAFLIAVAATVLLPLAWAVFFLAFANSYRMQGELYALATLPVFGAAVMAATARWLWVRRIAHVPAEPTDEEYKAEVLLFTRDLERQYGKLLARLLASTSRECAGERWVMRAELTAYHMLLRRKQFAHYERLAVLCALRDRFTAMHAVINTWPS